MENYEEIMESYKEGYAVGYDKGHKDGYEEGYKKAFEKYTKWTADYVDDRLASYNWNEVNRRLGITMKRYKKNDGVVNG